MVLVFGTMGDIAGVVCKALEEGGVEAVCVDFKQNLFHDEFGYHRLLVKSVARYNPEAVMPVGHPLALARAKAELASLGVKAIVEREELIRRLDSKVEFSRLAAELGIPQPRFYASPDEVEEPSKVVFKRDVSFGGHGVHQPLTMTSLLNLIAHQSPGEPYLIEDFIEGTDWSVDAVRLDSGECRCSAYRSLASQGKGPSMRREIVDAPQLCAYARRILDHLDYHGVCGFDFRVAPDGSPYILEANPRFTGGLSTQIEAGFNIPLLLLGEKG